MANAIVAEIVSIMKIVGTNGHGADRSADMVPPAVSRGVADQGVSEAGEVDEAVPVGIVARKARPVRPGTRPTTASSNLSSETRQAGSCNKSRSGTALYREDHSTTENRNWRPLCACHGTCPSPKVFRGRVRMVWALAVSVVARTVSWSNVQTPSRPSRSQPTAGHPFKPSDHASGDGCLASLR
jgi:hypothetical protein